MAETADEVAAEVAVREWRQRHAEQVLVRQRSQVETAKLLVTFTLAVGATVVATALQVGTPTQLDLLAVIALAGAFTLTLVVIVLDRLAEPNPAYIDSLASTNGWTNSQQLAALQSLAFTAQMHGESVIRWINLAALAEVLMTIIASALAAASLLVPLAVS